jgi:hypothetical protein
MGLAEPVGEQLFQLAVAALTVSYITVRLRV